MNYIRVTILLSFAGLSFLNSATAQVTLTLFNKSSAVVDSVVFTTKPSIKTGPIDPGQEKKIFISVDKAYFHSVVPFSISLYSPNLNIEMPWYKTGFTDSIYYFTHGIMHENKAPPEPEEYELLVYNHSITSKIDSIYSPHNAIKKITEMSPRSFEITLNHKLADIEKAVYFQLNGKILKADLTACGFNNWKDGVGSMIIYDDSVLTKRRENIKLYEFFIDFEMEDDPPYDEITVTSKSLVQTYSRYNGRTVHAVFKYNQFISKPHFKIRIQNKVYHIKIRRNEIYKGSDYKPYYIKNGKISNQP